MSRPRFLMIAPAMPSIAGNGLAMRLGSFLEALARAGDTELAVIPVAGRAGEAAVLPESLGVQCRIFESRPDTHLSLLMRIGDPGQRLAAFRAYGRPTLAGLLSPRARAEIATLIAAGSFDLVHVARLYLSEAAMAGPAGLVRTIDLDDDDVAAFRARSGVLRREGCAHAADWANAEADAFAAMAGRVLPCYSRIFAASGSAMAGRARIVPNSVAFPRHVRRPDDGRTLVFVGSMSHEPNADGITWFVRDVWPLLLRAAPLLRLAIVGRDPPASLQMLDGTRGIAVHGAVADLDEVYSRALLAIAPLRSGGGTRIKLIEAAAHKVPFVATSAAAAGLALGGGQCGWIADGAAAFAGAVLEAVGDGAERMRRAERAYRVARRLYDRSGVVSRLAETFAELSQSVGDERGSQ